MVKITTKIWKTGGSFVITVPKALIDSEVIREGQTYIFEVMNGLFRILSGNHAGNHAGICA